MRAVTIIFSAIHKEGEFFILNDGGDMMYWNTVDSESLLKDTRGFGKNNTIGFFLQSQKWTIKLLIIDIRRFDDVVGININHISRGLV